MTGSNFDRVEVITSVQRRRRWSVEEKLRIVEESLRPGVSVATVARRHEINTNQLYTWRRQAREGAFGVSDGFVPVRVVEDPRSGCVAPTLRERDRGRVSSVAEISFPNGCCLRVDSGLEPGALRRLVTTLLGAG